jgi:hypothetical protein
MYKESDPKLLEAVRKLIAADPNRYTQRYIGAQVGALTKQGSYSGSYVSTWLNGKGWTGSDFEPALKDWLAADAEERKRRRTDFWRRNHVADTIKTWLDFSMAEGKVIAITGDSGIGKTETIDHCLSEKRGVFRLQASPQRNSAKHIVATLRDIIGESHPAFASAYNPADGIIRYFLEYAHLIVVDDFDLLIESAYEFLLRDLWNQTRLGNKTTPQIWLGNEEGIQRIRRLSPQLKSRLRHVKLDLEDAFDTRFVREFMEHHLEDCELTAPMVKAGVVIANLPGSSHLRLVRDLCREVVWNVNRGDEAESIFFDAWENMDDYLAIKATAPRLLNGIGRSHQQSALSSQPSAAALPSSVGGLSKPDRSVTGRLPREAVPV